MAFTEDPCVFINADTPGNKLCVAGAVSFYAAVDAPDEATAFASGVDVLTRETMLTYITADVVLARGTAVTVGGVAHVVREAPRQFDDGVFSRVLVTRV